MISKSKSIAVIAVLIILLVVLALVYRMNKSDEQFKQGTAIGMDTVFTIKLIGDEPNEYIELVAELDNALDAYDEASPLYKLNLDKKLDAQGYLIDAVKASLNAEENLSSVSITAGRLINLWDVNAENPKVPDDTDVKDALASIDKANVKLDDNTITLLNDAELNLGCCAKGYACDIIKSKLLENDVKCAIVSFGSSTLLYGEKPEQEKFVTAVTNPFDASKSVLTVKTDECFVSTSGGYQRYFEANGKTYSHIFDLSTGYPAETDLASVTVFCDSGIMSDMLSTELYIGGSQMLREYLDCDEYMIIAIDKNKNIYASSKLLESITLKDESFTLNNVN